MSRYVSVMVPLESGQSSQILLERLGATVMCDRCHREASIVSEAGEEFLVGKCSSCAFRSYFVDGLGIRITKHISLSEFFANETAYAITVKEWLDAYIRDNMSSLVSDSYKIEEIEDRIHYLLEHCLTGETTASISNKILTQARHKLDIVSDMGRLSIHERKTKRAKRN
jgi:hypothetical protein